jgi:hypothetical protein
MTVGGVGEIFLPREVMNNQLNWWSADGRYFSFDMVDENIDQSEYH